MFSYPVFHAYGTLLSCLSCILYRQCLYGDDNISLGWVKAHVGIAGNDKADEIAKMGAAKGGEEPCHRRWPEAMGERKEKESEGEGRLYRHHQMGPKDCFKLRSTEDEQGELGVLEEADWESGAG